jgi:hypothetical protein
MRKYVARRGSTGAGRFTAALASALVSSNSFAAVDVEASTTLTRESLALPAGRVATYEYALEERSDLVFSVRLARWRRNPLRIWLVDEDNFSLLTAGENFDFLEAGTGMIRREAQIEFHVTEAGRYYVVLDNTLSNLQRDLDVYAYALNDEPSTADVATNSFYQIYFDALAHLIDVGDIQVQVRRCGQTNAYSIGSLVVICRELDNLLSATATPGVRLFVLLHEISHSLIAEWGYSSIVRNQFIVDRLAATLFALVDVTGSADAAALWFMDRFVRSDDSPFDESLGMSRSRARHIAEWLQQDGDLERMWTRRIVVPRLCTTALEKLIDAEHLDERSRQQLTIELTQRQSVGAAEVSCASRS